MMSKLLLILLILPLTVLADVGIEIDLSWQNATENVDDSPYTDNDSTRIYFGYSSGDRSVETIVILDPGLNVTGIIHPMTVPNNVSVYAVMTHMDLQGNESAFSNEVQFGPFAVLDNLPSKAGSLSGSARIVGCPSGFSCENQGN